MTTAVAEVIVTGVVLFVVYWFVVRQLGLEPLGAWSILSAMSAAARIGEAGFAAAPVRFVSQFRAREAHGTARAYGQTAIVTVAALMLLILALAAWPIARILQATVDSPDLLDEVIVLIPVALAGTWLLSVSSAVQSCLDGAERVDLRTYTQMLGVVVFLLAVLALVPPFGLSGLAWALLVQGAVVLCLALVLANRTIALSWPWSWSWSRTAFRDMFSYGVNLQVSSVAVALFEPVTKALLARFGDLSLVGLFEMVSRLVTQVRSLLTAANRALVPVYSRLAELEPRKGRELFNDTFVVSLFIAVPVFGALVVFSPDIGRIWVGQIHPEFAWMAGIICLGRLINTLIAPAYFANLGQGHPGANALGHVVTSGANLALGALAGIAIGGIAVVWAYSIAIVLGSTIIQAAFMRRNGLALSALRPSAPIAILTAISVLAGLAAAAPQLSFDRPRIIQIVFVVVALSLLVLEYRNSPLFRRLVRGQRPNPDRIA